MRVQKIAIIIAFLIFGVCILLAIELIGVKALSVASNEIQDEKLIELKQKAAAGDSEAQYSLTLYADDAKHSEELLEKSALAGHLPAVVTLAEVLINRGGVDQLRAKTLLENASQQGYYPAIAKLVGCLNLGECGQTSKVSAYMWAAVANLLVLEGHIRENQLAEEETRLRSQLTQEEFFRAQASAKAIVQKILAKSAR